MNTPEREIQKAIITYLRAAGHLVVRLPLGPMIISKGKEKVYKKHPLAGFPDLFGVFRGGLGKMFAIEVKAKDGRLTDLQKLWLEQLKRFGVIAFEARSVDEVVMKFKEEEAKWKAGTSGS